MSSYQMVLHRPVETAGVIGNYAPLARFVPLATLAAVLFVVAYNMGEWREIAQSFVSRGLILPFGSPRLL
jgi:MFS superfamily sulfate permease-like transporter